MTSQASPATGWGGASGIGTTFILLRHGVTAATERKAFSGSGDGTEDPELTDAGHEQAQRAARWLADRADIDAIVASPMRRTRQTAAAVAGVLGLPVDIEPGVIETAFGDWDGHTFAEIQQNWGDEVTAWLGDSSIAPPGGESMDTVFARVSATRDRLVETYAGKTVLIVSHVTPIKMLVRLALDAPMDVIYAMELSPASITTVQWWSDGRASLRNFNIVP